MKTTDRGGVDTGAFNACELGVRVWLAGGCGLPDVGCGAGCVLALPAVLGLLAAGVGEEMSYLAMKSANVGLGSVADSAGPVPSGSENY